ncbi:oligosaccharide flippase family protein [Sulfurospirillum oryzae]|uniref:oligosaccharide flippase family protein n=1 Tax=Sulfurospirillum oryzae TaxID=2976535 RepID=UPI0021E76C65|nr:oligosaccharide flippase family protein [Sulfurospirillum oryzae]
MIKIFLNSSFIYMIGALSRGVTILLVPLYTRFFSPAEYGIIEIFAVLGSFVSLTVALEISQAVARFYHEILDIKEKISYVSTALIFSFLAYMSYLLFSFIFADYLVILFLDNISYKNIFYFANIAIVTSGLFYFLQNQLKWQMQATDFVISGIIQLFSTAGITIYLLAIYNMGLQAVFLGQILGNLLSMLWSWYNARENYYLIFSLKHLHKMLSFSFPLIFSSIAVFVALYVDRILIREILGLEKLGIYGVAYRFASIVGILLVGVNSSLTPLIYKHYNEDSTPFNISKIFNIFSLCALLLISCSLLFSKEIIFLFTTEKYYSAMVLITPLIISLFFSNMYVFTPGLSLFKKTKLIAFISILSAFINVILNYIFIYFLDLYGATIGGMIGSIIIFIIHMKFSQKYYMIPFDWNRIMFCFFLTCVGGYSMQIIFDKITMLNILLKIGYLVLFGTAINYLLLKTLPFKRIYNIMKEWIK